MTERSESVGGFDRDADEEEIAAYAFAQAQLAIASLYECVSIPVDCDFESVAGPYISGEFKKNSAAIHRSFVGEGWRARTPATDGIHFVGFNILGGSPLQAILRVCSINTGVVYKPGDSGRSEEIINDDATAQKIDYLMYEDSDGNLRVDGSELLEYSQDLSLCDEYR